jgi:nucleoside-diphosphate-sugar epimerase
MQRVLVVGGAGYIGGATVDVLNKAGYTVRVYDNLLYEGEYRKEIDFAFGDVRDQERIKPHLEWAEVVVWLAAIVGDGACAFNPRMAMVINRDTVSWLSNNFDGRIIFMSTCSVFGAQDGLLVEDSPTDPLSVYAASKLEAEQFLMEKNALIFRLGTIYGVGDLYSRVRLDLVVNTLTVRAHTEGKLSVFGGEQYRPLIHVWDVAETIVHNLTADAEGVYNLHSENIRIIDLAERVSGHFDNVTIERTVQSFEDTRNYKVSSDKAIRELSFAPTRTTDDGIEDLKKLLDQGRIRDVNDVRYVNHGFLAKRGPDF